jgi:Uncharacterized protein conserved in bacteria
MRKLFITGTLAVFIGLLGCKHVEKIEREDEPAIYTVGDDDKEMNEAIKTANQTLHEFEVALKSKNPSFSTFSLKTSFKTPQNIEHIWVSDIKIIDGNYFGIVDNLPEYTNDVKLGDTIEIKRNTISDWMYLENNKLHGGYTIRAVRNKMTEKEKKQFDEENGLLIE